jgi:hypothetical protein
MDWITVGALALVAAVAIVVAWSVNRASRPRPSDPHDRDDLEALEWEHDAIKRGTPPEASGL